MTAAAASDVPMSLPLHRTSVLTSRMVSVSGNVITVMAALTLNQLATSPGGYCLRVAESGGSVKDGWDDITANSTTSVGAGAAA